MRTLTRSNFDTTSSGRKLLAKKYAKIICFRNPCNRIQIVSQAGHVFFLAHVNFIYHKITYGRKNYESSVKNDPTWPRIGHLT